MTDGKAEVSGGEGNASLLYLVCAENSRAFRGLDRFLCSHLGRSVPVHRQKSLLKCAKCFLLLTEVRTVHSGTRRL